MNKTTKDSNIKPLPYKPHNPLKNQLNKTSCLIIKPILNRINHRSSLDNISQSYLPIRANNNDNNNNNHLHVYSLRTKLIDDSRQTKGFNLNENMKNHELSKVNIENKYVSNAVKFKSFYPANNKENNPYTKNSCMNDDLGYFSSNHNKSILNQSQSDHYFRMNYSEENSIRIDDEMDGKVFDVDNIQKTNFYPKSKNLRKFASSHNNIKIKPNFSHIKSSINQTQIFKGFQNSVNIELSNDSLIINNGTGNNNSNSNNNTTSIICDSFWDTNKLRKHLSATLQSKLIQIGKDDLLDDDLEDDHVLFEDVFTMKTALLEKLLQFLNAKDLFSLIQISKNMHKHKKFFELNFKNLKIRGLFPNELREKYWMSITGAQDLKNKYGNVYYQKLLSITSPWEKDIKKDIDRTFIHNKLFRMKNGPENLYNLLIAFSNHAPYIGYCQGMNFIAGTLLIIEKEINAFYILMAMMERYKLKNIFIYESNELSIYQQTFDLLLSIMHPELFEYLVTLMFLLYLLFEYIIKNFIICKKTLEINSSDYVTSWINTLFSYSWNYNFVIRLWDIFLKDGWKFLYKISLTILKINKEKIFKMDPDNILPLLKHFTRDTSFDGERVLLEASDIKLTNRLIKEISTILSTGKIIKKLHLYYDPKIGKKNWRYEFDDEKSEYQTSHLQDTILMPTKVKNSPKQQHHTSIKQISENASSSIFSSLMQKLISTINPSKSEDCASLPKIQSQLKQKPYQMKDGLASLDVESDFDCIENIAMSPSTNRNRMPNSLPQKTKLFSEMLME